MCVWLLATTVSMVVKVVAGTFRFRHPNMTRIILIGWIFLILFFVGPTISTCQGPYLNLCQYDGEEYNGTEIEDVENNICNCDEATFCSQIELSEECDSAIVVLQTNGNVSHLHCNITSLNSQVGIPSHEIINQTDNEFFIKVYTEFHYGRYIIVCEPTSIPHEILISGPTQWDLVDVNPAEVLLDSEVKLQLTIIQQPGANSIPAWCFIHTPDSNTEVLSTSWISDTQIHCERFSPGVPGTFAVSLSSTWTPNIFDKSVRVKVTSKHPIALEAEYSYDFKTIFIYFDGNIELQSNCAKAFPAGYEEYFGVGYDCFTRGNVFGVKMGEKFEIVNDVEISVGNKIFQAGAQGVECLSAQPVSLPVSKPKVSGSNLNLHINSVCAGNTTQKHMRVEAAPSKLSDFGPRNEPPQPKTSGKGQRKNLMTWRTMRQVERKFSSRLVLSQLNESDLQVRPVLESLSSLGDVLDLGFSASVSVGVRSSFWGFSAEANVTFCGGLAVPFRHSWAVNGKDVMEEGKMFISEGVAPGKYLIRCAVVASNSSEVLGQGWATTEIPPREEEVFIVPFETTVGTTDNIFLRAVPRYGSSVFWTCRTELDGFCLTTDQKLVGEVIDLNSPNVSIPGGTLPVGGYIWAVENARAPNKAKVFIKEGSVAALGVATPSLVVQPSEEVVLHGTVGRLRGECRVWWSSVRQEGFSFLNVVGIEANTAAEPKEDVPLVIPTENRKTGSYLFKLQVFCPHSANDSKGSYSYLKVPLMVGDPLWVSPPVVEPQTGKAMITDFSISGGGAEPSVEDPPLVYEWSYVDPCQLEVPIKRGAFFRNFTALLPPGDLTITLRVCNGKKICSTASTPGISVIQESDFPRDKFENARNQIERSLESGDILEGFGLAVTSLKSLALLAETETREKILSTVEKGIKTKIEVLTRRIHSDPRSVQSSLEFFERAMPVAKYFRKDSDILHRLMEFRSRILRKN